MNNRSGVATFFLFLFLLVMILFQVLSMVQADRLYERLDRLIESVQSRGPARVVEKVSERVDAEEYPGDEGGWLVWNLRGEPSSLNTILPGTSYGSYVALGNIFEQLLHYDIDEVKLVPWLAESFEISEDGLEIYFKLRDDIHFSDGVPITADDVIFTFETIMNPGVDATVHRSYYSKIDKVVRISDREVKFVMKEVYFKSLDMTGLLEVYPKHIYEFEDAEEFNKWRSNPVGSGPYVFEKWDVGKEIVLRRNENYWGKKPKIDKIVFKFISNEVAALQSLRSHDIDFIETATEQFVELSKDKEFVKDVKCLSSFDPSTGYGGIGWNLDTVYFEDKRVRRAMTHIIDREAINEHIYKGIGHISTGPLYMFGSQYDSSIEPWPYDLEKARQLLSEAGWKDRDGDGILDRKGVAFRFKFMYPSGGGAGPKMAKLLKDEASKVGIDVIPEPYEWSIFAERLKKREFDCFIIHWSAPVLQDPYQLWHSSQVGKSGSNYVGFRNAEVDAIVEEARRTVDEGERDKLYHRFHRIIHEEQPYTFLITRPKLYFLDGRFENVKVHTLGLDPHEWYVPKEKQRYK